MTTPSQVNHLQVSQDHPVLAPLWALFERAQRDLDVSNNHSSSNDPTDTLEYKVGELDQLPHLATTGEYPYYVIADGLICANAGGDARLVFDSTFTSVEDNVITTDGLRPIHSDTALPNGPCTLTITKTETGQFDLQVEYIPDMGYFFG